MIPESEKKEGAKIFSKIVASAQPFFGLQTTACDAKGRLIFIETNGVPFFDGKGKLSGFRGISRDVTERKAFEKQLQDKERLAVIGATAGMVGHDIRNPLQALASEVYMLKSDLADLPQNETKESVNESIVSLEKNIAYINKIVSDLQDYAKKLVPEKKCVDLSEVIVRVFGIIDIPENIEVSFGVKGLPSIRTDPEFVQRALTNLVNNAVQAMPGGGKLEITGIKTEGKICLIVSDTGVGIPEEIKSKLFTPMMTTKSKGQGFGLAATKRLIEALGGSITFESEAGKGTKFIIELPFTQ
jgi:signal transduction histidine kinase